MEALEPGPETVAQFQAEGLSGRITGSKVLERIVLEVYGVGQELLHLCVGVGVVIVQPGCSNGVGSRGGRHVVERPEAFLFRVLEHVNFPSRICAVEVGHTHRSVVLLKVGFEAT